MFRQGNIETDTQDIQTQIGAAGAGLNAIPDMASQESMEEPDNLHNAARVNQDIGAAEVEITAGDQYTTGNDEFIRVEVIAGDINTGGGPAKISIRVVINDGTAHEASYDKEVELGSALTDIMWLSEVYAIFTGDVVSVFIASDDALDTVADIECNIYKAHA